MAHFCLRIDEPDWEVLAAHLQAHGLEFAPPETRYGADGHGPSIYITDPEGNIVELKGGGAGEGDGLTIRTQPLLLLLSPGPSPLTSIRRILLRPR